MIFHESGKKMPLKFADRYDNKRSLVIEVDHCLKSTVDIDLCQTWKSMNDECQIDKNANESSKRQRHETHSEAQKKKTCVQNCKDSYGVLWPCLWQSKKQITLCFAVCATWTSATVMLTKMTGTDMFKVNNLKAYIESVQYDWLNIV